MPECHESTIKRKDLFNSLVIAFVSGLIAVTSLGWFAHRVYAQKQAAQALLCRQQNIELSETNLQALCSYAEPN